MRVERKRALQLVQLTTVRAGVSRSERAYGESSVIEQDLSRVLRQELLLFAPDGTRSAAVLQNGARLLVFPHTCSLITFASELQVNTQ